jgi:glutamine---fructose-6-phosphate transaminase (isomerizing)
MTHFLRDILRQPSTLKRTIDFLLGTGRPALEAATAAISGAGHVYLTGIGSSWHAALTAGPLFHLGACPVHMLDVAELLEFATIPSDSVIIAISRSGRSVEVVNLLNKIRNRGMTVIGITNSEDGPLTKEAQISIVVPTGLDHAISVNTYSTLAATAGILASSVAGSWNSPLATSLSRTVEETASVIPAWQAQIADSPWPAPGFAPYFLARGSSLGSCHEARLLWEEGVKSPATAMGTGSFRHGPQEMVAQDVRFGMWIDQERAREQDLAVARDLCKLGASVLLIGQDLPKDAGDLVFQLPAVPPDWQFLIDIIPVQLTAERLARLSGVDCDSFRYCSFIVEDEYGLLSAEAGTPKDKK